MGLAVTSWHFVSAAPSSSGEELLKPFPWSSMGSLSWETALRELLQPKSFPCATDLHELLLLHWPWSLQNCFSHIFSLLPTAAVVLAHKLFHLHDYVFTGTLPQSLMSLSLFSVRSILDQLVLALSGMRRTGTDLQKPPLDAPHYQNIVT